ncbi:MAG: S46 family peptidase [Planctomycetia bacterium]|nr:S46 family peptidase [Planctomycetia bacterium]
MFRFTLLLALATMVVARADEGMWLYNAVPVDAIKKKYGFEPSKAWLENLQKASVRVNAGGSASFISPEGLVITNHHVASDALQKLGTEKLNYYRDGYYAKTRDKELKCEGTEFNVLMQIVDVTAKVNAAVPDGTKAEEAALKRRAVIAKIEKDAKDEYKLQPQVVTLFQGGAYHLYLYKKYTDVRLVFAPEMSIAFFGGDPDNFEFPRFDLDITMFRVYEEGKPAKTPNYLKFSTGELKEGDLTFVSGHPGRTRRLNTLADLEFMRDFEYPYLMQRLNRLEVLLSVFSDRNEENRRQAKDILFSVQNSRKARVGGLAALLDPKLMAEKKKEQDRLIAVAQKDPKLSGAADAWKKIAAAQTAKNKLFRRFGALEGRAAFFTDYFAIARHLVRAAEERTKENKDRLPEYSEARLETLTEQLFSNEPIYDEFEIVKLTDSLTFLCGIAGYETAIVKQILAGKSPVERARELVTGTKLKLVAERKRLYEGGQKAIEASTDPMILLAILVDPDSRMARKQMETQVEEPLKQAYADVAKVKFAADGTSTYPDATFTLRLSYGAVKSYREGGKTIPAFTKIAGAFDRSKEFKNRSPFDLPESWMMRKDKLNLDVPFNFVSTNDIIGGNSGSPVVNQAGEFVGIIFDGNIQSLRWDFAYDDEQSRATSVDARAILESLRKVYDAEELVRELLGKS